MAAELVDIEFQLAALPCLVRYPEKHVDLMIDILHIVERRE